MWLSILYSRAREYAVYLMIFRLLPQQITAWEEFSGLFPPINICAFKVKLALLGFEDEVSVGPYREKGPGDNRG